MRLAQWAEGALLWEEAPEADLQALHLRPLEQDASITSTPQHPPEMFSAGMVASRSLLPRSWEEEIEEERGHPALLLARADVGRLLSQLGHLLGGGLCGDAIGVDVGGEEKIVDHGCAVFHVGLERVVFRRGGR